VKIQIVWKNFLIKKNVQFDKNIIFKNFIRLIYILFKEQIYLFMILMMIPEIIFAIFFKHNNLTKCLYLQHEFRYFLDHIKHYILEDY